MWIVASIPLWVVGMMAFGGGIVTVVKTSTNETGRPAFKSASDAEALRFGLALLLISALFLYLAAKVAS